MELTTHLDLPIFEPGSVWLAGAGPGDPGLVTLNTYHGLRHADTIVYDALVGEAILELAGPGAALEYAGKRGGRPSHKQADISLRLIDLARAGKRVLRLKGGDPMVFGRGGEEALSLVAAGIPFRIVPGITAGIGGLAYAGIPLTHRESNHVVTLVTGHDTTGGVTDSIDWQALAAGSPVIVFYMAMKHLPLIADRLMAAGRRGEEAVGIVCHATLPHQRVHVTTLQDCAADAVRLALPAPAIVAVGEVVRMRTALDWLGASAVAAVVE